MVGHFKIRLKKNSDTEKFENSLRELKVKFEKIEYFPGYEIYKIEKVEEGLKSRILDLEDVKRVVPMHRYYLDFRTKVMDKSIDLDFGSKKQDLPVVGILDNGVRRNELLNSWLYEDDKVYTYEKIRATHGTFVAGVLLQQLQGAEVKIYDATIVPDFDVTCLEEDELLLRLKKAVEEHSFIKFWNLSVSIRYSVSKEYISDFGAVLDYLQEAHNILFIKSAGNGDFKSESEQLILEGADSVRALVVGATNKQNCLSSFSLGSKGHKIVEKPDIATYGGDIYLNEEGKVRVEGVLSFSPQDEVVSSFGTSFAAAKISGMVGELLSKDKNIDPLFVKAFLANIAKNPQKYELGYGYIEQELDVLKEFEKTCKIEGEVEEKISLEMEFDNHELSFTMASEVGIDYSSDEYIIEDLEIEARSEGKILKNIYGKYEKLGSIKKYRYELEEKSGKLELLVYRRKREKNKEVCKKMKFCIVTKSEN